MAAAYASAFPRPASSGLYDPLERRARAFVAAEAAAALRSLGYATVDRSETARSESRGRLARVLLDAFQRSVNFRTVFANLEALSSKDAE